MLTFNLETWDSYKEKCSELWEFHFKETAIEGIQDYLDIDDEKYKELEKNNLLKILTVYEDNDIIGYYVVLLGNQLHCKHKLTAQVDTYYIKACKDRGWKYSKMFKEMETLLKRCGVKTILSHENIHLNSMFPVFCRQGYRPIQVVYRKELGE